MSANHTDPAAGQPAPCATCPAPIDLDGTILRLRHTEPDDWEELERLYHRLSAIDVLRRFFTGGLPPDDFFVRWAAIESDGGFGLVAELDDAKNTIVGEATYSLLKDGDAELGIVIDPDHRGWLGPWMLDCLLEHARERGLRNLQALIRTDNQAMMALAKRRGYAILGHPEWGVVRLTMSTSGHTPSWPPDLVGPRVVVESERFRWMAEDELRDAGFNVAVCPGAADPSHECPVLQGEVCPLLAGADAVVIDFADDDRRGIELLEAEKRLHPDGRVISGYQTTPGELPRRRRADEIIEELGDLRPAEPDDGGGTA